MRLGLLLCLPCLLAAQEAAAPPIRTSTQEVLLDLVVRDKKDRLVTDLKPSEIEVYEDGVPQQVKGFRLVGGSEGKASAQVGTDASVFTKSRLNPLRDVNLVSIVFQQMSPRSRQFARDAALEFLNTELRANTYAAVFSLDFRLNALQQFTNDKVKLTAAVNHVANAAYSQFAKESEGILNQLQYAVTYDRSGGSSHSRGLNSTDSTLTSNAARSHSLTRIKRYPSHKPTPQCAQPVSSPHPNQLK